jgi:uncharacterized protein
MKERLIKSIDLLRSGLATEREVRFAYLFGSQARGDGGPLSDIDVAVYLDESVDAFNCRLRLIERIVRIIGEEDIEIVVLNTATPLLKHEVVKAGVVLKEDKARRVSFEVATSREYLDTAYLRNTQLADARNKLKAGRYFG